MGAAAHRQTVIPRLNLEGAFVRRTDLSHASLRGANLAGADLTHALLRGADLKDAILRGTILRGADLSDVRNLTQEQLSEALVDEETVLPPYLAERSLARNQPKS
jgi:uncharacterized protein YjbI with pentapeptide repeats